MLQTRPEELLASDTSIRSISPFVKWAGGKASLVGHLIPFVPIHLANYFEPFLGGGALFLALCKRHTQFGSFLSDSNHDLVNAFIVVKERTEELAQRLSILGRGYETASSKEDYYYERRRWRPTDPVDSAARLIFLNKTCYNGLYRVNSKGEFNVPFGRYESPRIFDRANLLTVSRALQETNANLKVLDYKEATANCRRGDFIYLDPPYNPTSKTSAFTSYTPNGFSEDDQRELARVFSGLVNRGCHVLLSNSDTRLVRELYEEYSIQSLRVARPINSVGTGRQGFKEVIIFGSIGQAPRRGG